MISRKTLSLSSSSFQQNIFISSSSSAFLASSFRFASTSTPKQSARTYYDRLELQSSATLDEIKKSYKQKALKCHPDVVQSASKIEKARAESEFRSIAEAYETLSNEKKRKTYDRSIGVSSTKTKTTSSSSTTTTSKKSSKPSAGFTIRKKAGSTRTSSSSSFTQKSSSSASSPFLSKDAQRIFREAFEGKSVHDVLFSNAMKSKSTTAEGKSTSKKQEQEQEILWQRYMNASREEIKRKFREKHPFADPKDYSFGLRKSHFIPDEELPNPVTKKFPFRPCASLKFSDDVHPGDEVPVIQATQKISDLKNLDADDILSVSMEPATSFKDGENERGEADRLTQDPEEYVRALRQYNDRARPANEGMVWSFRRQF